MKWVFLLFGMSYGLGIDNGLGKTPQMGYNSWYDLGRKVSESVIRETVEYFVKHDLKSYGYKYVNLDDCWAAGRDEKTHVIYANTTTFSSRSLKPLADFVHSHGLLFGVYTDRGGHTCAGKPGSYGYEKLDAKTYASWGVDYVKEDSCNAPPQEDVAFKEYGLMRDALNATGRPIWFAICGWQWWYATKGKTLGNSWRIGIDDYNWKNALINIDINANLSSFSGSGGWNDPGFLLGEGRDGKLMISELQSRAQFSMWAVMASPLMISANIRNSSAMNLETWTNKEVIAVNQDPMGKQGIRVVGENLVQNVPPNLNRWNYHEFAPNMRVDATGFNVWARVLSDGSRAFVFFNVGRSAAKVSCDRKCFDKVQIGGKKVRMRDLWSKEESDFNTNDTLTVDLSPEGGFRMFKMTTM